MRDFIPTAKNYVLDEGIFVEINRWEYFCIDGTVSYFVLHSICHWSKFILVYGWHKIFKDSFVTAYFIFFHYILIHYLPCTYIYEVCGNLTEFHAFCVDSWLTTWRTFCPVCKRDARTNTGDPPASESTPLLSSSPASVASSVLSSMRSSLASSPPVQIAPASSRSPSVSRIHSFASNPYVQQSLSYYRQSPPLSVSRSSVDLRNASSQRSHASHLVSPHSLGYPSLSPLNSRYMSPYIPSPSYASPSFVSSSGHQQHPLHCSESAASFSPFASAQSLPDCWVKI